MKLTVDAVVFSYHNEELHTLLIKRALEPFKGMMALAGGFVGENESTDQAVLRKLKEETNVDLDYLEQLYTFSDVDRDPRERIVSVAYYGLIDPSKHELLSNVHADSVQWFPTTRVKKIPMAFDHGKIHKYALQRLRNKLQYEPIGFELLPKLFTLGELHKLYEVVLDREIDRRNFVKKINTFDLLHETKFMNTGGVGRPAKFYEFNVTKYKELKETGINFEL